MGTGAALIIQDVCGADSTDGPAHSAGLVLYMFLLSVLSAARCCPLSLSLFVCVFPPPSF